MGLEICEQLDAFDAIVIPVGGGGLLAGVALAVKTLRPDVMVIACEPERAASWRAAVEAGRPVTLEIESTLADGLAVPCVGENAYAVARPLVSRSVTVSERFIALAVLRLVELEKAVCEGAGATALAALLQPGVLPELRGKRVVVPLCGGNIDTTILGRCLDRGLAADGRLCRFIVTVSDRPGGIARLTGILATVGASIKDIFHERAWLDSDIFSVQVKCVVETRDYEHAEEVRRTLEQNYSHVMWGASVADGEFLPAKAADVPPPLLEAPAGADTKAPDCSAEGK